MERTVAVVMMSEYEGKSEIFAAAIELPITSGYT